MSIIELTPIEAIKSQTALDSPSDTIAKQWPIGRTIWVALGVSLALWGLLFFGLSLLKH